MLLSSELSETRFFIGNFRREKWLSKFRVNEGHAKLSQSVTSSQDLQSSQICPLVRKYKPQGS